jgi:hypothetical protein
MSLDENERLRSSGRASRTMAEEDARWRHLIRLPRLSGTIERSPRCSATAFLRAACCSRPSPTKFYRRSFFDVVEDEKGRFEGFSHVDDWVPHRLVTATGPNPLPR